MSDVCFIVSCVGRFQNSGSGTGGLMLVADSRLTEIDRLDSTGLYRYGELIFRVIRKLKLVVIYNMYGVKAVIQIPEVEDAHDILVDDISIYCVSTGTNSIMVYDHFGRVTNQIKLRGVGDAWHVNCLRKVDGSLYASAFGMFSEHREWANVDYSSAGIIFNIDQQSVVHGGLNAPHNPLFLDGRWVVCNSLNHSLTIFAPEGKFEIDCGGFTRGLAFDDESLFVGVSANRKSALPDVSRVLQLDRVSLKVVAEFMIPYPEVYDIIKMSQEEYTAVLANLSYFSINKFNWQEMIEEIYREQRVSSFQRVKSQLAGTYRSVKTKLSL